MEITFHSHHYMLYVNGDVLDIVAIDEKHIERIKEIIPNWIIYEQEHAY
ncbi:hypothetical protein [Alkalicoccus daliensis]|nr:hypothetical protein [Alkalicoccus daliensis]